MRQCAANIDAVAAALHALAATARHRLDVVTELATGALHAVEGAGSAVVNGADDLVGVATGWL
jgi:hypothetical protein